MASGDTLLIFTAKAGEPPASNAAQFDTRNQHFVIDYDSATDEDMVFKAVLPQHYGGGGVSVFLHWSASGVTSGNVVWNAAFERIGDGVQDIDSDGFAAANAVTDAAPGTDGDVTIAEITFTNGADMDSVAVGELFRLKITRDANNASDTMAADAELHAIEIRES